MKMTDFYALYEERVGQLLLDNGFAATGEGEHQRTTKEGTDRVFVDEGRGKRFSMMLGFRPDYVAVLDQVAGDEDVGFPCGPYLTPVGVGRREEFWSLKDQKTAERSLAEVAKAICEVGLPWLERLRDPTFFLSELDPNAVLDRALAAEAAGQVEVARNAWEEMYDRCKLVIESGTANVPPEVGKSFVLVAGKLDRDPELRREFAATFGFKASVTPLARRD